MSGMSRVQIDKENDVFLSAVFVDSVSVMGRIQKEFFNMEFWKICFHSEKGMEKGKHIMPGGPSPAAVRLGIMAFAVTGRTALFLTVTDPFLPLLGGSTDRSTVTGKSQMLGINQAFANGLIQELLLIKPKNEGKRILRF